MNQKFVTERKIKFHEADPAGIVFFAHVLTMAHETFELFVEKAGIPWGQWFSEEAPMVPIRHLECNYHIPFLPNRTYQIQAQISNLGESSFQMHYEFKSEKGTHAEVKMVHTFVDKMTKKKGSIPESIRQNFTPFCVRG